jgi:UDP-N-acetylmuramate dehydrogenase
MHSEQNIDLTPFNTLALPGKAARYQKITTQTQLTAAELPAGKRFILGGGSNLVLNGDFDGLILHMAIPGKRLLREDATKPGISKPGLARTGMISCNGRWLRVGRGWKTSR